MEVVHCEGLVCASAYNDTTPMNLLYRVTIPDKVPLTLNQGTEVWNVLGKHALTQHCP
jgi:hypothetical protein